MIFGSTGRKANRPISERTRAAESIFLAPNDDEDAPPSVMYAGSSAFVSRARNNAATEDNETMSVLELMSYSNLWKELKNAESRWDGSLDTSTTAGKKPTNPSFYTFETLPNHIKKPVKELILYALSDKTLSSDQIVNEAQSCSTENMPEDWSTARLYCSSNVVVTTLCELVKEGTVQCLQRMGPEWTVKDWDPRYRRSKARPVSVEPQDGSETSKVSSRSLKIAKPWKRVH